MKILAIDPGITSGYVLFKYAGQPVVIDHWEFSAIDIPTAIKPLVTTLREKYIGIVVIEDYRIYQGAEGMHVGQRLYTAELIGAIKAICSLSISDPEVQMIPAAKKGRWPDARLRARYPYGPAVTGTHALDALKIGLTYIEQELSWEP